MKLNEFIEQTGISKSLFARRAGIGIVTLYHVLNGKIASIKTLQKIELATKGACKVQEMLPPPLKSLDKPPKAGKA